ncbi:hypothetical protein MW887_000615 [Aspergillus wentii]|nr:hypothetical protein MW887_000615 [Aspergillus wentii]
MPPGSSPPTQNPEPYQDPTAWHQQPHTGRINEAVNSAFGTAGPSSYVPPEVLSQITANVIQQLRATGLQGQQPQAQQPPPPPQPQPAQQPQWPPPPPPRPASASTHSYTESPTVMDPRNAESFPPPPSAVPENAGYQPRPPSTGYSGSPRSGFRPSPVSVPDRRESPGSQNGDHGQKMEGRPHPPSRNATVMEMTTLEKIWGKLFVDGKPTKRLGQFLRGIAVHLIEDYPPDNTIVIVPEKLQKFYEDTKVPSDPYPWQDIFDDRTSSISRLFREVEAEHHLVQAKLNERPDIPGLTPRGFERWATLMIQAHPEKEFKRLQEAVLNMPISNPDDKKERFPKEIPRRLFPEVPDLSVRENLDQFISKHCGVDLPPITEEELSQAAAHRRKESASSTTLPSEPLPVNERERQTYSRPTSAIIDDEDEEQLASRPIERERKPYTAQPGGGKVYEEGGDNHRGHAHSFSTGSRPRISEISPQEPRYPRTGSAGAHRPIRRVGRSRSSSRGFNPGGDYRHSDGDLLGHGHSHNGGPRHARMSSMNDYYLNSGPGGISEESRRYRDEDRENEEKRLYDTLREREREREKSKYHDHLPHRGTWAVDDEDYYRGILGSQGGGSGGPVGGAYDYKTYTYR